METGKIILRFHRMGQERENPTRLSSNMGQESLKKSMKNITKFSIKAEKRILKKEEKVLLLAI